MNTTRWRPGDLVSTASGRTLGKVIELRRHRDNRPFLMVQILGGQGRLGAREFPDGWVLGTGPHLRRCLECRDYYRTAADGDEFCPVCRRHQRPEHDPDATSSTARRHLLHGTATPTTARPVAPAESRPDDFETPF